jgi:hypothetical protein
MPGVDTPCMNRQKISIPSVREVAARPVVTVNAIADATMVRRRPKRSASRPTIGAVMATATVGAVIVRLTANADAPKMRDSIGSSGWVA